MSKPRDTRDRTPQILTKIPQRRHPELKINLKSTEGLYMTTVNPCNDFLIDFLIASKLKAQKQGIGKHTTYNLAIESVRKYPLPLICEAQLAALEGFGDFFINQAAKRIQKHYKRGRLPTPQEVLEDDNQHFEALHGNRRRGYNKKKKNFTQMNEEEKEDQSQQLKQEEKQQSEEQQNSARPQSAFKSASKSTKSKTPRGYTPRAGSQAEKILKSLYMMRAQFFYATKGQINEALFEYFKQDNVTSWESCRNQLRASKYVQFDPHDKAKTKLTGKGYNFISDKMGDDLDKILAGASFSVIKITKKNFVQIENRIKMIYCQNPDELKVVVNKNNQEISQQQMIALKQILQKKHRFKVKEAMLEEGTFLWEIDGKLIDFTVNRFNLDQSALPVLSSYKKSIVHSDEVKFFTFGQKVNIIIERLKPYQQLQGRINLDEYDEQKVTSSHIKRFSINSRMSGFKVFKSRRFTDTINYVAEMTWLIKDKLKKLIEANNPLDMLDTIEKYNQEIQRRRMLSTFYYKLINKLPGINTEAARQLSIKFSTFKVTFDKLEAKFIDNEQKVKLIFCLLKEYGVTLQQSELFVNFFFANEY